MKATEKHYVCFYSPGVLFSEETSEPIEAWDARVAVKMAADKSRAAKPYGFRFETYLEVEPIDASGETFEVEPKLKRKSGCYLLGGTIRAAAEVLAGTDPGESILRSNVRSNGYRAVVENRNSWRITVPFGEDDRLLDADGSVVAKGEDYPDAIEVKP